MEFVSPTKWPNLKNKAGGFQFGLETPRDAELSNGESDVLRNVIQIAVYRMLEREELRGQQWSHMGLDYVWALVFGNETNMLKAFWKKW